jgi:hypothetical protein
MLEMVVVGSAQSIEERAKEYSRGIKRNLTRLSLENQSLSPLPCLDVCLNYYATKLF